MVEKSDTTRRREMKPQIVKRQIHVYRQKGQQPDIVQGVSPRAQHEHELKPSDLRLIISAGLLYPVAKLASEILDTWLGEEGIHWGRVKRIFTRADMLECLTQCIVARVT